MATKIVNLQIKGWDLKLDSLDDFDNLFVIGWYKNRVIGTYWLPIIKGEISQRELEDLIYSDKNVPLWKAMADDELNIEEDLAPPLSQPISIAVCTRDRPNHLKRCLDGFMALANDHQEFLVIDNAPSTNDSQKIAAEYGDRVRYILEPRPGLNIARNRAIQESRHDIILFNDDDAVPDPNWHRALTKNFSDPKIMSVSGLTLPVELLSWEQEYFERLSPFQKGFTRRRFTGNRNSAGQAGQVGAGANMAFRKEVFDRVGLFDEALDAGTLTKSGGDAEMFGRILFNGFDIIYDPSAVSWHTHRSGNQELHKTMYGYGVGIFAMWTRMLLRERNWQVLRYAKDYFVDYQLNQLRIALSKRPHAMTVDLIMAEIRGCLAGPVAYLRATRRLRRSKAT